MMRLVRVDPDEAPVVESFEDHTVFQTIHWQQFVSHTQKARPVVAVVKDAERVIGRFTGLVLKKHGLPLLGSPFPGWTTSYMGFNLVPQASRTDALVALEEFAFRELGCVHFELMDRRLNVDDVKELGYHHTIFRGFEVDLTKDEDTLLAGTTSACRRCLRKATKMGVKVEKAEDVGFVDDYYAQLQDVFAKQRLVPTYPKERVRALVDHLLQTDRLLLVRARNSEGVCIATGIFPAMNDTMYFWGGASWRPHQHLRPNEAVHWFAMRYWKARGVAKYDMQGEGEYKRKFGGREIEVPWVRKSKYPLLERLRNGMKTLHTLKQHVHGLTRR